MPEFLQSLREAAGPMLFDFGVAPAIKILVLLFGFVMPLITYLVLAERKILGFIQARLGPNRVGPWGVLQPIADVVKLLLKEDVMPTKAVKWAFVLGPCLVVAPAFVMFSVIPFGPPSTGEGVPSWFITDVNTGALLVIALATVGVYGLIIGGWSSNNKFSMIGGLRSAAQMISYEVPQGLAVVVPLLLAGTLSLVGIVQAQTGTNFGFLPRWYILHPTGFFAFFVFFVAGVAESNRSPFDLPEAETELVAGFHTEYSGMRFALFFLGEYANMIVISSIAVTLFFGGWLPPFEFLSLDFLPLGLGGVVWFVLKLFVFLFIYIWFRGTFPRYRFDQLMDLGWKWMIPMALGLVVLTALLKLTF